MIRVRAMPREGADSETQVASGMPSAWKHQVVYLGGRGRVRG